MGYKKRRNKIWSVDTTNYGPIFIGLPLRAMPLASIYVKKKTRWRTELLEGFARPIRPSMGSIIAGTGQVMVVILRVVEGSS